MFDMEAARMFVNVVECGSLSKAASALFLAKSTVKNRIDTLERQIGCPLAERSTRGIELTAAGHAFMEGIRHLLAEQQALEKRCLDASSQLARRIIRVALYSDFVFSLAQYCCDSYLKSHPDDKIVPVATEFSHAYEGLRNGMFDVAFCPRVRPENSVGLISVTTFRSEFAGLVATNNPLATRQSLSREDLAAHEVVVHRLWWEESGGDRWGQSGPVKINVRTTDKGVGEMQNVCARGGIYLFPLSDAAEYPYVAKPLDDPLFVTGSVTCTTAAPPAVLDYVREAELYVRKITSPHDLTLVQDLSKRPE